MNGQVDESGRALISVSIRPPDSARINTVEAWIDTGFTGELVLSQQLIKELSLPQSGTIKAVLADGSEVVLTTHSCQISWFGNERQLEVVANEGQYPLLGVGLLLGLDVHISYRTGEIAIT
jgi:clan AA aspartic protease